MFRMLGVFVVGSDIDVPAVVESIAIAGGEALALALGAGAGFVIAKKALYWLFGRM